MTVTASWGSRFGRAAALATALLAPIPAVADEPGAPRSGFYVGGHVGYMFGRANATLRDPIGVASAGGATGYGAFVGGVQADYEHFFASRLLVGDGQLTYASENVIETYYAFQLVKGITATTDYQFIGNPAYNAVRGPVHVFSGRLSARF